MIDCRFCDYGWVKKTREPYESGLYVRAHPVTQVKLPTERITDLADKLMSYLY